MNYDCVMAAKKDFTQIALDVVRRATGEVAATAPSKKQVAGRKGGATGGAARAKALTPDQRSAIARNAAAARWKKQAT